jgi:hypothetical protein
VTRRVLFVLRGKLGETVVAFATVRAFADAYPGDDVTLLVRANYAPLFERETGMRVIGFSSRLAMFAKLALLRFFEAPFEALLVLLGAGPPIERLGRMVRAHHKVFLDGRFKDVYTQWPQVPGDHRHFEPAWLVARAYEPALAAPLYSRIPSLAAQRRPAKIVAIAPVSDEPRRSMGPGALYALIPVLARWHPGCEIHVLINPADRDARPLLEAGKNAGLPAGAQFERFATLRTLVESLYRVEHLYSTDTGLYHLAAALGVPTTTYYGPTQPWKNGFPAQPDLTRVRLAALGGDHCEEKQCRQPVCLANAVALHAGAQADSEVDSTPPRCLLRRHTAAELAQLAVLDGPEPSAVREPIPVH